MDPTLRNTIRVVDMLFENIRVCSMVIIARKTLVLKVCNDSSSSGLLIHR